MCKYVDVPHHDFCHPPFQGLFHTFIWRVLSLCYYHQGLRSPCCKCALLGSLQNHVLLFQMSILQGDESNWLQCHMLDVHGHPHLPLCIMMTIQLANRGLSWYCTHNIKMWTPNSITICNGKRAHKKIRVTTKFMTWQTIQHDVRRGDWES